MSRHGVTVSPIWRPPGYPALDALRVNVEQRSEFSGRHAALKQRGPHTFVPHRLPSVGRPRLMPTLGETSSIRPAYGRRHRAWRHRNAQPLMFVADDGYALELLAAFGRALFRYRS